MPAEYITHFLMFSARTSANQTQDYIDNKLDKRYASSTLHCPAMYVFVTHCYSDACACVSGGRVFLGPQ